jgi:hypothetical protein
MDSPLFLKWSLLSPFIDTRERRVTCIRYVKSFLGRKGQSFQSCPAVGGVPLLEEWPMSFDAVVMFPDIRGPRDDTAMMRRVVIIPVTTCLSLRFDWRREPRPRRHESWHMISPCSREHRPRAALRMPRRPGSCV